MAFTPRLIAVFVGSALFAAAPVLAQSVKWAAGPSAGDVADALLGTPAADGAPGRAEVRCQIAHSGELTDCTVVAEEPTDRGFGGAALAITARMRAQPAPDLPTEVTVPLRFDASPPLRPAKFGQDLAGFSNLAPIGPYFPERAERNNVGGYALAECHLAGTGALSKCAILDEQPEAWGFSDATIIMARRGFLTAEPRTVAGQPVADEVVRVLVKFPQPRRRK